MEPAWLIRPVSVAQAEAANTPRDPPGTPFGLRLGAWRAFIAQMKDGDELWEFRSPRDSWAKMCGMAGYSLVRRGEIVDSIILMQN